MILISLDEGGRFEQLINPECMLIGGLVFQCESNADINREKGCLKKFFQTICSEQECRYPQDLHPERDQDGKIINKGNLEKVKNMLADQMADYLQKKGRWSQGRPVKGSYYTYCMIGDLDGLGGYPNSNLRDNIATVRYDHMIYRTIENLIFYNPYFQKETDYKLHLPTRVVNLNNQEYDRESLKKELKKLGYRRRRKTEKEFDNNVYEVTDEASFRTALESAMQNGDRTDLQFELMIQSINYKAPQDHQVFLYLSDTLCSIYQDAVNGSTTSEEAFPALYECEKKLTGEGKALAWAYHPKDREWRSCWADYCHGNWFDSLKTACDISCTNTAISNIYKTVWIKPFENVIDMTVNIQATDDALARLDLYMRDLGKRNQETAVYIISHLEKSHEQIRKEAIRARMEYMFSKIMTGLYNHQGNFAKAEEEYQKCMNAARYVPIEEYLGFQLFYIVCLCDSSRYVEAEKLASDVVSHHEALRNITESIYPGNKLIPDSYGRALSQHGQCLTLLGRFDEALADFNKAMEIFGERTDDWFVTGSYRLHTIIEMKDKKLYSVAAREYFKGKTPNKQFKSIMAGECGNIWFALYVFLKGLWVFGDADSTPDILRRIIDKIEDMARGEKLTNPWQQIMKYCAFLTIRVFEQDGDHTRSEEIMRTGRSALTNAEGILVTIREENETQYQLVLRGEDYTTGSRLSFTYR